MTAKRVAGYFLFLPLLFATAVIASGAESKLAVTGEVKSPLQLTLADLKALPAVKADVKTHEGKTATYEGVPVAEILKRAGVPAGEALRGEALRLGVLVKAADGYQVVFTLAELDPAFADRHVILAYRRDGVDLNATEGPLRLVVPEEKRQARSVRQVMELEIIRVGTSTK